MNKDTNLLNVFYDENITVLIAINLTRTIKTVNYLLYVDKYFYVCIFYNLPAFTQR